MKTSIAGFYAFVPDTKKPVNVGDKLGHTIPIYYSQKFKKITPLVYGTKEPKPEFTLVTCGSLLNQRFPNGIILGTGIASVQKIPNETRNYIGVRGPLSAKCVYDNHSIQPKIVSDPGLLCSKIFPIRIEKKRKIGVFLHKSDLALSSAFSEFESITNYAKDPIDAIRFISECEIVLTSSLHGCVIAHSFNIPAIPFIGLGNVIGGDFKFIDYFKSIGFEGDSPIVSYGDLLSRNSFSDFSWVPDPLTISQAIQNLDDLFLKLFNDCSDHAK